MKFSISKTIRVALSLFLASVCFSGCSPATSRMQNLAERVLWYNAPAQYFEEALPLGNGRIGATVYGGVKKEHILLNEETLWAGGPVDADMNPEAYKHLPEVRAALFAGDYARADILVKKIQGSFSESYAPLGDLYLEMHHKKDFSNYRRKLNIRNAVARVNYQVEGVKYSREIFVSYPDQLLVIRLTSSEKGKLGFNLRAESKLRFSINTSEQKLEMSGIAPVHAEPNYRGDIPDAVTYDELKSMRFFVAAKILKTDGIVKTDKNQLKINNASEAVILVSMATSFNGFDKNPGQEGKDEKATAAEHLTKAEKADYRSLYQAHTEEFWSFFNRVSINLGHAGNAADLPTDLRLEQYSQGSPDPDLEALYFQFGRYLLISSSRPGGTPANLQGIWNPHLRPPWSSNYTTNINLEMNYWPAEVCNLSEMHQPLLSFISNLKKTGRISAKTFFNCRGWSCSHNSDIWAMTNPVGDFGGGDPSWANWNMAGAWLSTHLWEHYEFTRDKDYLRKFAYPLMKGAALFCLDWLTEDDEGILVTAPATSPENIYLTSDGYKGETAIATTADMAMIRELFLQTIKASSLLNEDQELSSHLKQALEKLYPYQVGAEGNLQEWQQDWQDADPQHRHLSHLFGLFPGNHLSPEATPELARAVKKSLEIRGSGGTGWSKAWKINLWARLADGNMAYELLRSHLSYTPPAGKGLNKGGGTYPNLWDAHPPFQIDGNFGGTAGIAEMLLQSRNGKIFLLPALPDAWPDGEIRGLKARGNFEVNIRWKEGNLVEAEISSGSGNKVTLIYNRREITPNIKKGKRKAFLLSDFY